MPGSPGYRLHQPHDPSLQAAKPEHPSASGGLLAGLAITPLGVAAACGLALLMTGALAFRLRVRDRSVFLLGDTTFLLLAAATAIMRLASG